MSWSTESGTLNDLWKDEKLNSFNLILSFSIVFEVSDEITNTLSFNSIVKSSFFIPGTARSISKESLFSKEFTDGTEWLLSKKFIPKSSLKKSLINDGGNFTFENGTVVTTAQEFVDFVEQDYQKTIAEGGEWGWNTDYAFAAYVAGSDDPEAWNQAGEWVNAQFTSSNGVYIEWYHIADGKLQNWYQTKAALPEE